VEKKHEAILQMYGEKAEEAEELRLDIQDLKLMYKQQVSWLVGVNLAWWVRGNVEPRLVGRDGRCGT